MNVMTCSVPKSFMQSLVKLGLADEFCDMTVYCWHNQNREELRISRLLLASACPSLQTQCATLRQKKTGETGEIEDDEGLEHVHVPVSAAALKREILAKCGLDPQHHDHNCEHSEVDVSVAVASSLRACRLQAFQSTRAAMTVGILLGLRILAAWMPAIHCKMESFFMDDSMIARNANVYAELDLRRLFRTDYWGLDMFAGTWTHKSFRPLTVLTFRWNYLLHGFNSAGFHITNLSIHLLCSGLLGVVGIFAGLTSPWAVLLALLFFAHPVHTESVLYIVGRADLLCLLSILLATLVHCSCTIQCSSCKACLVMMLGTSFSCGLLLVAGLCKETGFCFFGLLAGWDILRILKLPQRCFWLRLRTVFVLIFGIASCACRVWYTGTTIERMDPHSNPVAIERDLSVRLLSYALVHGIYGKLLIWPVFLCYDYSFDAVPLVRSIWDARMLLSLATYLSFAQVLTVALKIFRSSGIQKASEVPLLGMAILLLGFLPMSNMLFPVGTMVAERLLYIPSAGLLIAVAGLAQQKFSAGWLARAIATGMAVVILELYAHLTSQRVLEWASPESITFADAARQLRSARVQYNLGCLYVSKERYDEALSAFRLVMEIDPTGNDCIPLYRSAQIHFYQSNYETAEQLLAKAVQGRFSPLILNEEEVFHDYALALWFVQKPHDAIANFEKSLAINSTFTKGLNNLGCALGLGAVLGQLPAQALEYGLEQMQQAVQLSPSSILYWRNYVALLRFAEEEDVAAAAWEQVLMLDPAGSQSGNPPEDCSWEFAFR